MRINTNYGNVTDDALLYAPNPVRTPEGDLYTNNDAVMLAHGYKRVVQSMSPADAPEGYYYTCAWRETDTQCVQDWTLIPYPVEGAE